MTSPSRSVTIHTRMTHDGRGALELRRDLEQTKRSADDLDSSLKNMGGEGTTGIGRAFRQQTSKGVLSGVGDALGAIPSRLRGIGIAAIVGLGAAAAPTLGAMIAGAVTGAVGIGGIAGGIAAASNSPAVKQAAKNLGSNIASSFSQMGDQFVEPLLRAFDILQQGWYNLNLEAAFEKVAAYVDDLAMGVSGFAKGLVDGLSNALGNAGPILSLMRTELPRLGDALGYMFDRMSQGRGTVEGFVFLMRTLDALIIGTGNTIGWLADRFHNFISIEAKIFGWLEQIPAVGSFFAEFNNRLENLIGTGNTTGQVMNYVGREFSNVSSTVAETTRAINILADTLRAQQDDQFALQQATHGYRAALANVVAQVKEHGTSLDTTTAKGNNNRQMIDSLVGGLMRERDAAIKAAGGNQEKVDRANASYARQMAKLQDLLVKMGFEKKVIAEIVGAYKQIPTRITTQIIQEYQTRGKPAGEHSGLRAGERRQHGGPVFPGVPYMINEAGRETVTFPAAGTVHPAKLTPVGSPSAGKSYTINVNVAAGANLREAGRVIVEAIESYERANGAGWRS